jgi:ADP-heptose:LPS heptosyltransferase
LTQSEASHLLADLPTGAEILIARLRSLGDIVLETPGIAALHEWRPDLRISLLVEPRFAAVLEGNSNVSELIFSRGLSETARALRNRRFPAVYNQHGGPRSALLTKLSGSAHRIGWKGFQFPFCYNVLVPDALEFYGRGVVHTVEHRISQFYATGLPQGPIPRAQIFPQGDGIESVERSLRKMGIAPAAPYAVMQPGSRSAEMRWPAAKFAEVARWLRDAHGIVSVVNLGAADAEIVPEVRREMESCAVIPEPFSLRALIALAAGSRVFLGNDSGPAHLAAAAGKPCVVIFGPTNPVQWHPWQVQHRVISTGAKFRPVRGDKSFAVAEPRPIQAITVDEVRTACTELLTPASSAGTSASSQSALRAEKT